MTGQLSMSELREHAGIVTEHERVRAEERATIARHRQLDRARARAITQAERTFRNRVRTLAAELRHLNPHCRCDLRGVHNSRELRALDGGCTTLRDGPGWVCPLLDAIRRRMGQ
jgi:hypothetical protein